jgi:exopolysaccharide biosynthesis polyprenyl glycosylphosphotransferase
MIQKQLLIILLTDMFSVIIAGLIAYLSYTNIEGWPLMPSRYIGAIFLAALLVFFIFPFFKIHRLYGRRLIRQGYRLTFVWLIVLTLLIISFFLLNVSISYSRLWLVNWMIFGTIILFLMRLFLVPKLLKVARHKPINNVVIVGTSEVAKQWAHNIQTTTNTRWHILAFFDEDKFLHGNRIDGIPIFGDNNALNRIFVESYEVDEIWITIPLTQIQLNEMVHGFQNYPVVIRFIPHINLFYVLESVELKPLHQDFFAPMFKRLFDLALSTLLLPILLLGLPPLALLIRLDSPGPIFFYQCRVGKNGKLFMMWKFRSMSREAEKFKMELEDCPEKKDDVRFEKKDFNDSRITRIGHFMRRYSIDELPQLWNVLKGDISLVGPRPAIVSEVEKYTSYQLQRLHAMQGITCEWQVEGRSNISFEKQVDMDLEYIKKCSFFYDLWLLLKTIPAVFSGRGAC